MVCDQHGGMFQRDSQASPKLLASVKRSPAQMVERRSSGSMDAPRFFAHRDHSLPRALRRSEMNVAHHRERISDCVIDRAFANFPAFDVRDGNAQRQSNGRRREHFVAIGDKQKYIWTYAAENFRKAKRGDTNRLGNSYVRAGAE